MNTETIALLKNCAAIERESAELYHWFSDLFYENRHAADIWKKTALEEENHESQFVLAEKLLDDMLAIPFQDQSTSGAELEKIRALRREFTAQPPDLVTALEAAILFEEELAEFHMENVLLYSDEEHHKMFEAMMGHDREHAESLKKLLAELTDSGSPG
jgi:rubrerythrin